MLIPFIKKVRTKTEHLYNKFILINLSTDISTLININKDLNTIHQYLRSVTILVASQLGMLFRHHIFNKWLFKYPNPRLLSSKECEDRQPKLNKPKHKCKGYCCRTAKDKLKKNNNQESNTKIYYWSGVKDKLTNIDNA